jgi:hypothetical protein
MAAINSKQRLKEIDQPFRKTRASFHDEFNRHFDMVLRKDGHQLNSLMDFFSLPPSFHAQIAEAKEKCKAGVALALQARHSSVREMPRRRRA